MLQNLRLKDVDRRSVQFAAGAIAIALAILFLRHAHPPLFDWPNHMARHFLESLALTGKPVPADYAIRYGFIPNLGGDMIVPGLIALFGVETASKLFLFASVMLVWGASAAFTFQYAGRTPAALVAALVPAPFLLTATLFLGFVNSYSGVGVGILAAVGYIHVARTGASAGRLAALAALSVLTYLWHLAAFGVYAVIVVAYACDELLAAPRSRLTETLRAMAPRLATVLPGLLVMLWVALTPETNALGGAISWSSVRAKLFNFAELFMAYDNRLDALFVLGWIASLVLLFKIAAVRRFDYVVIAALMFFALAFILPTDIGLTYFIDKRPIHPLFLCCCALLAGFELRRQAGIGLALLALVAVARIAYVDFSWARRTQGIEAMLKTFDALPAGRRILVANTNYGFRRSYEMQATSWVVARRGAYVSNLWAVPGQQPLRHRAASYGLVPTHFLADPQVLVKNAAVVPQHFDYVWLNDPTGIVSVPAGWTRVLTTEESSLWKVR